VTVLVTGATGFLGSRLAKLLADRGREVRVLVRATSNRRRLEGLDLEIAEGDVTDRSSVEKAVHGVDTVYHAAALYEFGTPDVGLMEKINVGGTTNVLETAHAERVPAVYVSSVSALGPTGPEPADESHRHEGPPGSSYAATKRQALDVARAMAADGARVRTALPPLIYGPDDDSVVGLIFRWLVRGWLRAGPPRSVRTSVVHVDDCAAGLVAIAERGVDGEEYVLSAQTVTFGEWYDVSCRLAGKRPPLVWFPAPVIGLSERLLVRTAPVTGRPGRLMRDLVGMVGGGHWAYSGDKARRELGWAPRSLEEGLGETIAWYQGPPT
jgi:nucleoside-diphosphate-sugar epimerase